MSNYDDEFLTGSVEDIDMSNGYYHETNNVDGTMHYNGALGEFDYDPTQFAIVDVHVPTSNDDVNGVNKIHVLRYIGTETDGNKIQIPDGIKDASMMFMHSNIKSTPKIPNSVESTYAMFAECKDLKTVNGRIPPSVKDGPFMFANCSNLEKGPSVIPGTMHDINYIFTGCSELKNTPRLGNGIQYAECAFADCKSLTDAPKVPRSMMESQYMTSGCDGIDAAQDAKARKELIKARENYSKKLDSPSLMQRMGNGFSAVLQVHAMRQAGYNMLVAPLMVHMMRKNGQLSKSFSGGVASVMMTRGGMSSNIGAYLNQRDINKQRKTAERNQKLMQNWDTAHAYGMGTRKDVQAQTDASQDMKKGLFLKVTDCNACEKAKLRQRFGGDYSYREQIMTMYANKNGLSARAKHATSKWYQEQMSAVTSYYVEGLRAIDNNPKYKTVAMREQARNGLKEISAMQLEPLMQSAENMQNKYHIFNEGDMRVIAKMTQNMPSEKAKDMTFSQRVGWSSSNAAVLKDDAIHKYNQVRVESQSQSRQTSYSQTSQNQTSHRDVHQFDDIMSAYQESQQSQDSESYTL